MTNEEMKAALDQANAALVDRLGHQPYLHLSLELDEYGKWECGGAYIKSDMKERFGGGRFQTPQEAFDGLFKAIDALPSPEDAITHEYLTRVASAVDYATANSIDEEYVAPLRGVSCAMTENLLTKEVTQ